MNPFAFPGFDPCQLDPSKMNPKMLMELSQLIQQLPPEQLSKMGSLMHNAQAGFDVRKDMEEFEKSLPPGFREKVVAIFSSGMAAPSTGPSAGPSAGDDATIDVTAESASVSSSDSAGSSESEAPIPEMDMREARLTVLRAVADGKVQPEEAERLLFG